MDVKDIKFKAKRLDNGEWIIGNLLHFYRNSVIIIPIESGDAFSVDPSTVYMFTWLKDKNGTNIYEEDIVIYKYNDAERRGTIT